VYLELDSLRLGHDVEAPRATRQLEPLLFGRGAHGEDARACSLGRLTVRREDAQHKRLAERRNQRAARQLDLDA
jgi:hypothetical protein